MAEVTAKKLNIMFPEATEYTLFPVQFSGKQKEGEYNPFVDYKGKPLCRGKSKILSYIYTVQKNFGAHVKLSKADIARACGLSYPAALDNITQLQLDGLIYDKDGVYRILPKVNSGYYFQLENWLLTKKFKIDGELRKLTTTAVLIIDCVKNHYLRTDDDGNYINYNFKTRKPINYFRCSDKGFATLLGLPKSTISYALPKALNSGLLRRNKRLKSKDEKGREVIKIVQDINIPGNTDSLFTVPYEVLAVELRSTYEPKAVDFIENLEDEIEVTEEAIEKVYTELHLEAEAKHAAARELAASDDEFVAYKSELDEAQSAAFEALANGENVQEAKARWDSAYARYLKRLSELGISEDELLAPPYLCSRCRDTGFTDTGQRCRCRTRVKALIISRIFKRK